MKNNCLNCDFKGTVAGSCHISCNYPKFDDKNKLNISILLLGNFPEANSFLKSNFGFSIDQHPVLNGWFNFPFDFDPSWIQGECIKHSKNPEVQKTLEAEKIVVSFMEIFKTVIVKCQNDKQDSIKLIHNKMINKYKKFNFIKSQEEFFELVSELKPLIKETEKILESLK